MEPRRRFNSMEIHFPKVITIWPCIAYPDLYGIFMAFSFKNYQCFPSELEGQTVFFSSDPDQNSLDSFAIIKS